MELVENQYNQEETCIGRSQIPATYAMWLSRQIYAEEQWTRSPVK